MAISKVNDIVYNSKGIPNCRFKDLIQRMECPFLLNFYTRKVPGSLGASPHSRNYI